MCEGGYGRESVWEGDKAYVAQVAKDGERTRRMLISLVKDDKYKKEGFTHKIEVGPNLLDSDRWTKINNVMEFFLKGETIAEEKGINWWKQGSNFQNNPYFRCSNQELVVDRDQITVYLNPHVDPKMIEKLENKLEGKIEPI